MQACKRLNENQGLPYFVAHGWRTARYGSERSLTVVESAIRARFVRDSFHSLSTGRPPLPHRLFPVALWYKIAVGPWDHCDGIGPMDI